MNYSKWVFGWILGSLLFSFSATCNATLFCRKFTETEQNCLDEIKKISNPTEIARRFEHCSTHCDTLGTEVEHRIHSILEKEASNPVARAVLEQVIAKLEPYVQCARSLKGIISIIPDTIADNDDKNAGIVVYFYNTLLSLAGKEQKELYTKIVGDGSLVFFKTLQKTKELLLLLQHSPVNFGEIGNISPDILTANSFRSEDFLLIGSVHRNWSGKLKSAILNICPLLTEKQFELLYNDIDSSHERISGRCKIKIGPKINAYMISGPRYFSQVSGRNIFHSVGTTLMRYGRGDAAIHEIHHHLVKCIDGDLMTEGFEKLIDKLQAMGCDKSYISQLEHIWTHMKEFRNITGIFFRGGKIYFDPFSEGNLSLSKYKMIRASHLDANIKHVPTALVELMQQEIPGCLLPLDIQTDERFQKWD